MDTYKIKAGDTLSAIAAANKTTVQDLMKLNPAITDANKIFAGSNISLKAPAPAPTVPTNPNPQMTSISSPIPAPTPTTAPTPPVPQAPAVKDTYFTSAAENVTKTRTDLEGAYKTQLADIEARKAEAQKNVDEATNMQKTLIDTDIRDTLAPFRANLETAERDRLHINENFEANQALVNELDSLLTEGNNIIKKQKGEPLALSVLNKKVGKTMDDIAARTGVIQAVMTARNGQISTAENMIDRSVAAITADRKDELEYYKTIYNFYESEKDTEGKKVLALDKDQADYIKAQIGLLEHDVTKAEENADNIKKLMQDPDTAMFMAKAGVTLNDTPDEVNAKMAAQAGRDEIKKMKNDMALKGYTFLPYAPADTKDVMTVDAGGQTLYFKAPAKKTSSNDYTVNLTPENRRDLAGAGLSSTDIDDIEKIVNEFGIKTALEAIDDEAQRQAVADAYNAQAALDEVESSIAESKKGTDSGTDSKPWWKFW